MNAKRPASTAGLRTGQCLRPLDRSSLQTMIVMNGLSHIMQIRLIIGRNQYTFTKSIVLTMPLSSVI